MRIRRTHPGPRARDPYSWAVEIDEEDGSPPVRLLFAYWTDEATGGHRWIPTGVEVGRAGRDRTGEPIGDSTGPDQIDELTAATIERFAGKFEAYLAIARSSLDFDVGATQARSASVRASRQGRRGLSEDFYREIAELFQGLEADGRPAISEIARLHGVDKSRASRWVARGRTLGFLPSRAASSLTEGEACP